jgi:hypothetical protein
MPPSSEPSSVVRLTVADVLDKKVFSFQDSVAVDLRDIAAARRWYAEKMGLDARVSLRTVWMSGPFKKTPVAITFSASGTWKDMN